ncbi:MAG: rhodanese-like domain-containing protein [Actinomycetota bacterium]
MVEATALHQELHRFALIDVRQSHEWERERIRGSINIPANELAERSSEIPAGRPVVTVCDVGQVSAVAATELRESGLDARNLWGGMKAWIDANLPTTNDLDAPDPVIERDTEPR